MVDQEEAESKSGLSQDINSKKVRKIKQISTKTMQGK